MSDNLSIWNALSKTDPAQTKAFKRSGGFSGTAVKPIWIIKQLTELFGPAGVGWGVNKPEFQVVPCSEGEILVYCTVSAWHGTKDNLLWGVGGDKVVGKNKYGLTTDDEAFKKAFTDATNNAFKSIGVAADIHMGLFDDDKYVAQANADFADEGEAAKPQPALISDEDRALLQGLAEAAGMTLQFICESYHIASLKELPASKLPALRDRLRLVIKDKEKVPA